MQRHNFRMLSQHFAGRSIDAVRKADVLAYFEARQVGAAPFDDPWRVVRTPTVYMVTLSNGHPQSGRSLTREGAEGLARRPLSPRAPETEIASLSAMFNYLLDPAGAFPAVVRALAPGSRIPASAGVPGAAARRRPRGSPIPRSTGRSSRPLRSWGHPGGGRERSAAGPLGGRLLHLLPSRERDVPAQDGGRALFR